MTRTARSAFALLALTVAGLTGGQAFAQATGDRAGTTGTGTGTGSMTAGNNDVATTRTTRDEGTNYSWLGLLGLAGLAGLIPRKPHTVATTTHRVGDSTTR